MGRSNGKSFARTSTSNLCVWHSNHLAFHRMTYLNSNLWRILSPLKSLHDYCVTDREDSSWVAIHNPTMYLTVDETRIGWNSTQLCWEKNDVSSPANNILQWWVRQRFKKRSSSYWSPPKEKSALDWKPPFPLTERSIDACGWIWNSIHTTFRIARDRNSIKLQSLFSDFGVENSPCPQFH